MSDVLGQLAAAVVGLLFAGTGAVLLTNWRGLADAFAREQWRMVGSYLGESRRRRLEQDSRRGNRVVGASFLVFGLLSLALSATALVASVVR